MLAQGRWHDVKGAVPGGAGNQSLLAAGTAMWILLCRSMLRAHPQPTLWGLTRGCCSCFCFSPVKTELNQGFEGAWA